TPPSLRDTSPNLGEEPGYHARRVTNKLIYKVYSFSSKLEEVARSDGGVCHQNQEVCLNTQKTTYKNSKDMSNPSVKHRLHQNSTL
ncbi:MAG: hypothetical protein NC252_06505, partial [Roseburia sp.]|nr:hypothetical protein [Roseburia sp.]MCM1421527.1 hypothetical protein [Bacteroides sp.]